MHLIISIVGNSHSGKTTLLEKLIGELKRRGHKVAMVKHSHHANELDTASKDTWRFTKAGSELSAINSLDHLAIYRRVEDHFDPQEISHYVLWDYDIILTEGFKGSRYPKIEVHRGEQGKELLTNPQQLLAVVTDEPLDVKVPQFSRDDINGIAELIEKSMADRHAQNDISLVIDGMNIPVSPSLQDLLERTIFAMIPAPVGNGEIKNLHLSLRRKV
jgi:molybdopterin-guanine dinucleotide biosynthesis protein B